MADHRGLPIFSIDHTVPKLARFSHFPVAILRVKSEQLNYPLSPGRTGMISGGYRRQDPASA